MKRVIKCLSEDWRGESREITSISASHNTHPYITISNAGSRVLVDAENTLIVIIIIITSPMDDEFGRDCALWTLTKQPSRRFVERDKNDRP